MLNLLLAGLATVGLLLSFACHLMAWLQMEPPLGNLVFLLHVGIFPLWIPLIIRANRTMPKPGRGNMEHLMKELPRWMRTAAGVLFAWAFVNFGLFMYATTKFPKHEVPHHLELRGFSGHWMMFYAVSAMGFLALNRLETKRKRPIIN